MNSGDLRKIIWLASYPKSGNTWFRAFITALLNDGDLDINELQTDSIFSSRSIFEHFTDMDSRYLDKDEVNLLRPQVYSALASFSEKEHLFVKVHDAYIYNAKNIPIIPTVCTRGVLYFIRNPLDIVASFANHQGFDIQDAVNAMNSPVGALAYQKNNRNVVNQFEQLMLSWSGHVNSWTAQINCPLLVVRYEDMILNTRATFSKCCTFIGINKTEDEIQAAIDASSFERLKKQENEKSFFEKKNNNPFFRQGKIGQGRFELNEHQIKTIIDAHFLTMQKFDYLVV